MKVKLLAAAAAVCAGSAFAQPVITNTDLGTLPDGVPIGNVFLKAPGEFLDFYKFTVAVDSIGSASVTPTQVPPFFGIEFMSSLGFGGIALLDATATSIIVSDLDASDGLLLSGPLAAGTYNLGVLGRTTGLNGGAYAGVLHVAAVPVPEPETYAMLLAGLGVMGLVARRRSR